MSTKPLSQKLWMRPNYRVLITGGPEGYLESLGKLPNGVKVSEFLDGEYDLIQVFVTTRRDLERVLPLTKKHLGPKGLLWLSYPKGTSRVTTDVNRETIRAYATTVGLTAVGLVSIDDTWSALRLKA